MNRKDFAKFVQDFHGRCSQLLGTKGVEYSGNDDALANFKRLAVNLGTTPELVCLVYMTKHFDAVTSFVKSTAKGDAVALSEPMDGRLCDLANYAALLSALVAEREYLRRENAAQAAHQNAAATQQNLRGVSGAGGLPDFLRGNNL